MPELPCPCQIRLYLQWFYSDAYIHASAANN